MVREITYAEVKGSLKTGDLVLFHGIELSSKIIEIIEWSFWSHVGMVVLPKDMGFEGDDPLFFEATSSGDGIVDVITGAPKEGGVMLLSLGERIRVDSSMRYDTHFKVRYLNRELTPEELEKLKAYIYKAHDYTFPDDKELLKYYVEGRHMNLPMPENETFCSQLVASAYMEMDMLSPMYVANGYCPNDFNEADSTLPVTKHIYFTNGARLDK